MSDGIRLTEEQASDLLPLVRGKVRKFVGGHRRHAEDRRDLVQDAFVRLVANLADFNPERGSLGDLAASVVDSVLLDHLRRQHAAKRDRRRESVSLNAPIPGCDGDATELADHIDAEDHQLSIGRRRLRETEAIDMLLDVSEALQRLNPEQRRFCELLKTESVADAAEQDGVVRGTGYRRLRTVRKRMQSESLRKYLE